MLWDLERSLNFSEPQTILFKKDTSGVGRAHKAHRWVSVKMPPPLHSGIRPHLDCFSWEIYLNQGPSRLGTWALQLPVPEMTRLEVTSVVSKPGHVADHHRACQTYTAPSPVPGVSGQSLGSSLKFPHIHTPRGSAVCVHFQLGKPSPKGCAQSWPGPEPGP